MGDENGLVYGEEDSMAQELLRGEQEEKDQIAQPRRALPDSRPFHPLSVVSEDRTTFHLFRGYGNFALY